MKRVLSLICVLALLVSALFAFSACGEDDKYSYVALDVEGFGTVTMILYHKYAPKTVANFLKLVDAGFYDGLTFHRIVSGFMIQGGDPKGNGTGGSDETIVGEFSENGFSANTLSHTRGTVSMARSTPMDSASSQFFIVHADATSLDGKYAAFGRVIQGMEVVDAIAAVPTVASSSSEKSTPVTPVVITRAYRCENPFA